MSLDTASLPDDVSLLKAMLVVADAEREQLRMQVAKLRRMQGSSSLIRRWGSFFAGSGGGHSAETERKKPASDVRQGEAES